MAGTGLCRQGAAAEAVADWRPPRASVPDGKAIISGKSRKGRAEQLGRPVVKAWNSIGSDSFAKKGTPAGIP
jgi:hypothetical protein